jgi:phosphoenolpyruvate-protein phosphotransferase (PTS system enzyme I)
MSAVLQGIGVSAGSAVGPALLVGPPPRAPLGEVASADPAADWARIEVAVVTVADGFEKRASAVGGTGADILNATALMARDPSLGKAIRAGLEGGRGPVGAVQCAVDDIAATFAAAGGYLAERVTDLRDVGNRVIARLLGEPEPGIPEASEPSVLIAHDLAPADTVGLSPATTLAIVTEAGGPTSHTAILAAQLGIPAVVHAAGVLAIPAGTVLAVDGSTGTVTLNPDSAQRADLQHRQARRAELVASRRGAGATRDGHPVALLANIGTAADARAAAACDVEGVGLFRTEFLYLDRATAPTVDEQATAYAEVFRAFAGRPVVVRTLDAGADKPMPFADLGAEDNPALGRRGLRLGQWRTQLLDDQLAALARAVSDAASGPVKVMAPMVATADEARWFAARVREHGLPSAGVMVEVPAAALRARQLLAHVDFASIGTNDLAQYTMAADRLQGELAELLDPWQPAVLDLIAMTAVAGRGERKPVGVCGEAAGDPLLALALAGFGVTSLSMAPAKVPAVRYALSEHDFQTCKAMADAARVADDATGARAAALALASPAVAELL